MELHGTAKNLLEMFVTDPRMTSMREPNKGKIHVHIAVIVGRGGKILAAATNKAGSRSKGSGYSDFSIHAEKNVIKELGDITKLRGADMYVMRISSDKDKEGLEKFMCSKPCSECTLFLEKCMREYGLKKVYYTS
jgi:hypothetical protein